MKPFAKLIYETICGDWYGESLFLGIGRPSFADSETRHLLDPLNLGNLPKFG